MGLIDSRDSIPAGADIFRYYSRAVAELLAKDDDVDSTLLSNATSAGFSDAKRERLKSLLRQSVFVFTPQVDEMLERVLKIRNWHLLLRRNQQCETCLGATSDGDIDECPSKKRRSSSSASPSSSLLAHESPVRNEPKGKGEDFLFFLKKDSSTVEAMLIKHSDELSALLGNMRQCLEEMLDAVMSRCRLMTSSEKERLRQRVVKLPEASLGRASEIVGLKKGSDAESYNEILEDLEKTEKISLWRLYYYVEALENAEKLGSGVTSLMSLTDKHIRER